MNRVFIVIIFLSVLAGSLSACGKNTPEPEELISFVQGVNEEEGYAFLTWEDRTYVPYCAANQSDRGDLIGMVAGEEDVKIYEYRGYPATEWIVDYLDVKLMPSAMLCREISVKDIPEGLSSEYEWNVFK